MARDLVPLDKEGVKTLQSMNLNMKEVMFNQFFLQRKTATGVAFSIKKDGLFYLLDQKHGGKYSLVTEPPPVEEYDLMRTRMGIKEGNLCIIMKSILQFTDGRKFSAYGTVIPSNIRGNQFPLELAETRAEVRVLKKALACGFGCVDTEENLPASPSPPPVNYRNIERGKRTQLQILLKEQQYTRDQAIALYNKLFPEREEEITSSLQLNYDEMDQVVNYLLNNKIPSPKTVDILPTKTDVYIKQINKFYKELEWSEEDKKNYWEQCSERMNMELHSEKDLPTQSLAKFVDYLANLIKEKKQEESNEEPEGEQEKNKQ